MWHHCCGGGGRGGEAKVTNTKVEVLQYSHRKAAKGPKENMVRGHAPAAQAKDFFYILL